MIVLTNEKTKKVKENAGMTWLLVACPTLDATSLASCPGSDEDSQIKITKEEVQLAFAKVKGKHTGKPIYPQREVKSTTDRTDTLDTLWALTTDSTMVIHNLPVKTLAKNMTNTDLRELLLMAPDQDLRCSIGFYSMSPVASIIQPTQLIYQLDGNGVSKKYEVAFYYDIPGLIGVYSKKEGQANMIMQIVQTVILEQGQEKGIFR